MNTKPLSLAFVLVGLGLASLAGCGGGSDGDGAVPEESDSGGAVIPNTGNGTGGPVATPPSGGPGPVDTKAGVDASSPPDDGVSKVDAGASVSDGGASVIDSGFINPFGDAGIVPATSDGGLGSTCGILLPPCPATFPICTLFKVQDGLVCTKSCTNDNDCPSGSDCNKQKVCKPK